MRGKKKKVINFFCHIVQPYFNMFTSYLATQKDNVYLKYNSWLLLEMCMVAETVPSFQCKVFVCSECIDSLALGGVSILKGQSLSVSLETPSS